MIKHIVMWKFKDEAEGQVRDANMARAKELLFALVGVIPELKMMEIGEDITHSDMSMDLVLITEFETVEDMNTYAVHPEHVKVSKFIRSVIETRRVIDYNME